MKLLTVDFETYYSKTYSLTKQPTEEYIRGGEYETIGVSVKVDDGEPAWASGSQEQLGDWLRQFPWADSVALAHNAMFDGAILNWHFGLRPKLWVDTLSMGRAIHGVEVGGSLAKLAERYKVGEKGSAVLDALGKHRGDFSAEELSRYGDYCINDTDLTYKIFDAMMRNGFPRSELKLIDLTLRMFTEPVLELELLLLEQHLGEVKDKKEALLKTCGLEDRETLMSNPKFAELLKSFGVSPPRKISLLTQKETWAFAKSDEEFKALLEHPDERVQAVVAARLGNKSTLEESRTERFIGIAKRGRMPVPLKYYGAHTGRWAGSDKVNFQNLPSRDTHEKTLKNAVVAPEGHVIINCDSSQIEARTLAWLAGQEDVVEAFARREDVYKKMASVIYGKAEGDVTKEERFIGKTTILGAGYGMGAPKFQAALKNVGVDTSLDECRRIIFTYREANGAIVALWRQAQTALTAMLQGASTQLGREGVLELVPSEYAIKLPNGLLMRYEDLTAEAGEKGLQYSYKSRRGRVNLYGGKVVENAVQALARIIVGAQMLRIAKKYRPVLTVHDAVVCVVPDTEVTVHDAVVCVVSDTEAVTAQAYIEECMRWVPPWAVGLPVNCESGVGKSYGEC
tara:strand:- start:3345 stop:5219 length:1875 start_codon:yes stop_codon:yes gene_type:complete